MMRCDEVERHLDDLIDGALARREAEAVEAHLARCLACRRQREEISSLRQVVQELPREVQPARDLWPAIESRLVGARWHGVTAWRWLLPIAATLAFAVALAYLVGNGRSRQASVDPPTQSAPRLAVVGGDVTPAIDTLRRAAATLREAVEHRHTALAGETSAAVLENLKIIDEAIARLSDALLADPGNRELEVLLVATLEQQIDVLQRASQMPAQV